MRTLEETLAYLQQHGRPTPDIYGHDGSWHCSCTLFVPHVGTTVEVKIAASEARSDYAEILIATANAITQLLDAEGDGGAVGEAVAEVYECPRDHHEPVPTLLKGIRFTGVPLPVGTKLYTQPARSGAVPNGWFITKTGDTWTVTFTPPPGESS